MATQEDVTKAFQQIKTYIYKKAAETEAKIPAVPTNLPQTYVKKALSLSAGGWAKGDTIVKSAESGGDYVYTANKVYNSDDLRSLVTVDNTVIYMVGLEQRAIRISDFTGENPITGVSETYKDVWYVYSSYPGSLQAKFYSNCVVINSGNSNYKTFLRLAWYSELATYTQSITDTDVKVNSEVRFTLDKANGEIAYNVGLKKTIDKEAGKLTFTADTLPTSAISGTLEISDTSTEGAAFVEGITMPEPTIPTKTSDLTNDSDFITSSALPQSFPWVVKKSDLESVGQGLYATYKNNRLSLNYGQSFVQGAVKIGTSEVRFTAYSGAMGDGTVTYASVFDISKAFGYTDGAKQVLLSIIPGSMVNEAKSKQAITEIGMSCSGIEFSALPSFELTIYNFGAYATPTLGRSLVGTLAAASWSSATVDDKTVYQQTIASEFFNGTPLNFTLYVNTKSKLSIVTVGSGSATIQCDTLPTEDIAYKGWLEYITAPAFDADTNSPLYRVQNDGDRMTETEVDEKIAAYQPTTLKLTAPNGSVYVVTVDNSGELSATLES